VLFAAKMRIFCAKNIRRDGGGGGKITGLSCANILLILNFQSWNQIHKNACCGRSSQFLPGRTGCRALFLWIWGG